jgi:hypothetical protein
LLYASAAPDPEPRGVVRFFQVSDTMLGPAGASETGWHCTFQRGDVNGDGTLDISDAICIMVSLFDSPDSFCGEKVLGCLDAADANDDSALNIADAVKVLGHLFLAEGRLLEPFERCDVDPTPDALTCRLHNPCM